MKKSLLLTGFCISLAGCSQPEPVAVAPTAAPVAIPTTAMVAAPTLAPPTPTRAPRVAGSTGTTSTATSSATIPTFSSGQSISSYATSCLNSIDSATNSRDVAEMSLNWMREKYAASDASDQARAAGDLPKANAMNQLAGLMSSLSSGADYRVKFLDGELGEREYNISLQSRNTGVHHFARMADGALNTKTETERENESTLNALRRGM